MPDGHATGGSRWTSIAGGGPARVVLAKVLIGRRIYLLAGEEEIDMMGVESLRFNSAVPRG